MTSAAKRREVLRTLYGDDCHLCKNPIDFTLPPGTWMGPSVEHVVPLAAGGADNMSNCRLAHAYPCNYLKGAIFDGIDYAALNDPTQTEERIREREEMHQRHLRDARAAYDAREEQWREARRETMRKVLDPLFESWSAART
jgi:hypothetical protein